MGFSVVSPACCGQRAEPRPCVRHAHRLLHAVVGCPACFGWVSLWLPLPAAASALSPDLALVTLTVSYMLWWAALPVLDGFLCGCPCLLWPARWAPTLRSSRSPSPTCCGGLPCLFWMGFSVVAPACCGQRAGPRPCVRHAHRLLHAVVGCPACFGWVSLWLPLPAVASALGPDLAFVTLTVSYMLWWAALPVPDRVSLQ